jgi:hypothetical protein
MTVTIEGPHFPLRGSGAPTVSLSPVSDFGGSGVYSRRLRLRVDRTL